MSAPPGGELWVSLAELARIKGVTRQSVSRRLKRLNRSGAISIRRTGRGGVMVRLAEWDMVTRTFSDLGHLADGDDGPPEAGVGTAYTQALTRKVRYEADLKQIELDRRRAELLDARDVSGAMAQCHTAIAGVLSHIPDFADDLADAIVKGGHEGAGRFLSAAAVTLRKQLAAAMQALAESAAGPEESESPTPESPLHSC